jgi:ribosomal protein L37E
MSFNCQKCARPLYNRRRNHCEFCGHPIPDPQRLSPEPIESFFFP